MPVSRQFASEQIMRLSGLRDFPPTVPARKELIAALGTVAHNEAHAVELIDAIVRGREFTPTPSDLYELVASETAAARDTPTFDRNPIDKLIGESWFYAELEPHLIERTFQWLDSSRNELRLLALQVITGLKAHGRDLSRYEAARLRR
jgi:hypothetical protein